MRPVNVYQRKPNGCVVNPIGCLVYLIIFFLALGLLIRTIQWAWMS